MKIAKKSDKVRGLVTAIAILFALPLGWKSLTGIFVWLSPFIMLNSFFVLKSLVFLNIAGFVTLVLSIIKPRFFCRFLCPAGWFCDKISGVSPRKPSSHRKVPVIAGWIAIISLTAALTGLPILMLLDPLAVFHSFFSLFSAKPGLLTIISFSGFPLLILLNYLFPHIWCGKMCPLGGMLDLVTDLRNRGLSLLRKQKPLTPGYSPARRYFIASGIGLISGVLFSRLVKASGHGYFRPPASVDQTTFNSLCIRCGNCIKSCPSNIITHHTDPGDVLSWMTPEVTFNDGYCLEECNLCSKVCPSGSITLFSPDAKNLILMGSAEVIYSDCLLAKNRECDRCKAACSYDAITIEPSATTVLMKPVVAPEKCVGCGACAVICPARTITMKPPIQV